MRAPQGTNVDKFKKQLSMDEIETIETLAQEYMCMYGYELMTNAQAMITENTFKLARERSEVGKQAAWRELEQNNYRDYVLRRFRAEYLSKVHSSLEQYSAMAPKAVLEVA